MLAVDVNVLVYAFDDCSPRHQVARELLKRQVASQELLLVFPTVAAGFMRVVTNRRIMKAPVEPETALTFLEAILEAPNVRLVGAEAQAWNQFESLVRRYSLRGPELTDVLLVACCVVMGAVWVSFDRGFARFSEITWRNPADEVEV